jgi:regulator of RNase E activity RraA
MVEIPPEIQRRMMGLISPDRIRTLDVPRPSDAILSRYKALEDPSALISDILDTLGVNGAVGASVLRPVLPDRVIVGPAVTLRYEPDTLVPARGHRDGLKAKLADRDAYAIAQPGDVAVFDAGGRVVSCLGGLSATVATRRGLAGGIVWGAVRDVPTIRRLDYPVWSAHVSPVTGRFRLEAAEINGLVDCGGVPVRPGDLVVADDTGVAIVPAELIEDVIGLAEAALEREAKVIALLERDADVSELRQALPPERW